MKAIIIGAGFTGVQLARTLIAEDNNVTLIDNDPERVRNASDQLDCAVIEADGNSLTVLNDAGISSADVLITLTEDDELNMITCSLVDSQYPDLIKIARVRNYAYYMNSKVKSNSLSEGSEVRPMFGIDHMVHPDVEAADAICRAMSHGAVGNIVEIGEGYGIVTITIGKSSPLLGKSLRDLSQFPEWRYLVAYVETSRGDILACGTTVFGENDRLSIVAPYDDIPQLHKFVGDIDRSPLRRIAVFGADRIGSLIVGRLISSAHGSKNKSKDSDNIIMVDANRALCVAAAERFDGIQVLCGDITDENLIAEESLHSCDLMVAASNNYDRNLITASYLKSRGVRRTIALTSGSDFDDISRKLGIDVTIPLRDTFVDCIMSRLRGRNVKSVHTVCNRAFEIVECDVSKDGKVAGKKIKDISVPGEFLVLLVKRKGESDYFMPTGDTLLGEEDRAVIAVKSGDIRTIRKFAGRK